MGIHSPKKKDFAFPAFTAFSKKTNKKKKNSKTKQKTILEQKKKKKKKKNSNGITEQTHPTTPTKVRQKKGDWKNQK